MAGLELDCDAADRREVISGNVSLEKKGAVAHESMGDIDDAHVGLEFPSEQDLVTLRRVSGDIPWTAFCWFFLTFSNRGATDPIWQ